jgi:hypothetical protein
MTTKDIKVKKKRLVSAHDRRACRGAPVARPAQAIGDGGKEKPVPGSKPFGLCFWTNNFTNIRQLFSVSFLDVLRMK